MSRYVKQAAVVLLTTSILTCSCSKSTAEPVVLNRLPADTITETAVEEYEYLQKITLREGKRISRPFFFTDCETHNNTARFTREGLSTELQLLELSEIEQFLANTVKNTTAELAAFDPTVKEIQHNDDCCVAEISYLKEKAVFEGKKITILQYPCSQILAVFRQADGSCLYLQVSVDNEFSTEKTGRLYREILDACGITYENN